MCPAPHGSSAHGRRAPSHRPAGALVGSGQRLGSGDGKCHDHGLLDTNATKIRITTYDTSLGAPAAAAKALADGNRLILGPMLGEDALAVAQTARAGHVPVISYTGDAGVAGNDVLSWAPSRPNPFRASSNMHAGKA
jgi:hypothetical protein